MGRCGRLDAIGEDAEEEGWVEGAVAAEEWRIGDDVAEGSARHGGPGEVDGGGEVEEDVLQEVLVEEWRRRLLVLRRRRVFEAGEGPPASAAAARRRHGLGC